MKICFVTDNFPGIHRKWFGAEIACKRIMGLCTSHGHQLYLFTQEPDHALNSLPENMKLIGSPILENYLGKLAIALKATVPFDFQSYHRARKYFRSLKPDIVHLHNIRYLGFGPLLAAKESRIPVVFSIYDNWVLCFKSTLLDKNNDTCKKFNGPHCLNCVSFSEGKPLLLFRKHVFNYFLKKVDMFLLLTEGEKRNFVHYGIDPVKSKILPLPLFEDEIEAPNEGLIERDSILFAGRITYDKGLHVLIESLPFVIKENANIKVRVIGEPLANRDYANSIKSRVNELHLTEYVEFLGKRDTGEVKEYLRKSHVVVAPEQWGIAWPIFITEAMSFGKIIVASNIGDIREFIEDGKSGYLADPKDYLDLAKRINVALNSGHLINKRVQEKIQGLCDKNKIYNSLYGVYETLCKPTETLKESVISF